MLSIIDYNEAESLIAYAKEEFKIKIYPNFINRIQLYLTGNAAKGVQIIGVGPTAMRAYYSLLDYSKLVGDALSKGYNIFIIKEGRILNKVDWYLEFRL